MMAFKIKLDFYLHFKLILSIAINHFFFCDAIYLPLCRFGVLDCLIRLHRTRDGMFCGMTFGSSKIIFGYGMNKTYLKLTLISGTSRLCEADGPSAWILWSLPRSLRPPLWIHPKVLFQVFPLKLILNLFPWRFGTFEYLKSKACDEKGNLTPTMRFVCGFGAGRYLFNTSFKSILKVYPRPSLRWRQWRQLKWSSFMIRVYRSRNTKALHMVLALS